MKSDALLEELDIIFSEDIKDFVRKALDEIVPDYFWTIPSSSTGKYHPEDEFVSGGLVLHTKRVVNIANQLIRAFPEMYHSIKEKDSLITACILHDTFKNGITNSGNTDPFHPYYVRHEIYKQMSDYLYTHTDMGRFNEIMDAVEAHEGVWSAIHQSRCEDYSSWKSHVHLADYFASRRNVVISL